MPLAPDAMDYGPRTFSPETPSTSPERVWHSRVEHAIAAGQPIPPLMLTASQVDLGRFGTCLHALAASPRPFLRTLDRAHWDAVLASAPAAMEAWLSWNPSTMGALAGFMSFLVDAVSRSEPQAFTLLPALLARVPPAAAQAALRTPPGTCAGPGSDSGWLVKTLTLGPWLRLAEEASPVACAGLEDTASLLSRLAAPEPSPWAQAIHQNILVMGLLRGQDSPWWDAARRAGALATEGPYILAHPEPDGLFRPRSRATAYGYTTPGMLLIAAVGMLQNDSDRERCRKCLAQAEDPSGSVWFKALCEEVAATPEEAWSRKGTDGLLNALVAYTSTRRFGGESEREYAVTCWGNLRRALAAHRALSVSGQPARVSRRRA